MEDSFSKKFDLHSLKRDAKNKYLAHYGKTNSRGVMRNEWLLKFAALLGYHSYWHVPRSSLEAPEEVVRALKMLNGPYFHATLKMLELKKGLQKPSKKVA